MNWLRFLQRSRPAEPATEPLGTSDGAADADERSGEDQERAAVLDVLRTVDDPEIGINIVDLGLVYGVEISREGVIVQLTMTTPSCPLGDHLTSEAERALRGAFPDLEQIEVDLVWDPPWTSERITPAGKRLLGWR